MTGVGNPRWLLSFADLLMLLLAFFVVLGASKADPARVGAGMRDAFGGRAATDATTTLDPTRLFEPGEAVLRPGRAQVLATLGGRFRAGRIALTSMGEAAGSGRLDRFELAAARTAAIGRALNIPADRIGIEMRGAKTGTRQTVTIAAR